MGQLRGQYTALQCEEAWGRGLGLGLGLSLGKRGGDANHATLHVDTGWVAQTHRCSSNALSVDARNHRQATCLMQAGDATPCHVMP